jgi:hypothetical protein
MSIIVIPIVILWAFLHGRYMQEARKEPQMLMRDPRQCVQGFKRIHSRRLMQQLTLPPLTKEDRL